MFNFYYDKMKLSSIFGNWINTIKKFPVSHLILCFITLVACQGVRYRDIFTLDSERILWSGLLAFIFSLFGPLWYETWAKTKKQKIINISFQILSIVIWIVYFWIIRSVDLYYLSTSDTLSYFGIIALSIILLLAMIAIRDRDNEKKSIQSYTNIVLWTVVGLAVGFIVWGGISGAFWSIDTLLFHPAWDMWKIYMYVWCISLILLAPSFGLNYYLIRNRDENAKISRINKIFWSYIFLPLTFLYLAIFLLYGIKILITWSWPKWVIIWLWFGYFLIGMIAVFLTYLQDGKIYKILQKVIFGSFLLIAMLMIWAIHIRIQEYGITINRYMACAGILTMILVWISALFFTNKRFLSVFCIVFVIGIMSIYWWPMSAKQISMKSQINNLKVLLENENISLPLTKNSLAKLDSKWTKDIVYAMRYLSREYGEYERTKWIIDPTWQTDSNGYDLINWYLGYDYKSDYTKRFAWNLYDKDQYSSSIDVSNFEKMYPIWWYYNNIHSAQDSQFEILIEDKITILDLSEFAEMMYDSIMQNKDDKNPFILEKWEYTYVLTYVGWFSPDENGEVKIKSIGGYVFAGSK